MAMADKGYKHSPVRKGDVPNRHITTCLMNDKQLKAMYQELNPSPTKGFKSQNRLEKLKALHGVDIGAEGRRIMEHSSNLYSKTEQRIPTPP